MTLRRIEYLEAALRRIAQGRGAFSRDPLTFAGNVIEDAKATANAALAGTWEPPTCTVPDCGEDVLDDAALTDIHGFRCATHILEQQRMAQADRVHDMEG